MKIKMINKLNFKVFKSVIIAFFLLIGLNSFAQAEKKQDLEEVHALAKKMFEDTNNRDFDALLEVTYPKLFELVPKEQMKTVLKMTLEGNNDFSIEIPKMEPKYNLSEVFEEKDNNVKYTFITYDMNMSMTFKNQEFDEESKKMMLLVMQGKGMEAKFTTNNSLDILKKNSITIALKDKVTNNKWAIINYDGDSPMMYNLLPSSILESAKKYKQDLMLESKKESEAQNLQKN